RLETYNFLYRSSWKEIIQDDLHDTTDPAAPIALMRDRYNYPHARSMIDKMLYLDWKQALADNDIRKVNRMCEAAGVEVSYPFMDDEMVNFSLRLPGQLKVKGFKLRYFFKRAMQNYLPPKVLLKPKHGFGLPFGVWMHSYRPLQELAYDSISDFERRKYLKPGYLHHLVQQHRQDHAAFYGEFIWILMMLELWLKKKG
ncbi:MAG: asparagine synthase C-terminal domain-containing protein, partial [Gammaproteobacteria bacterium]|nr:asparagine synthase C-terminal domain-containing protein [Gammaproteobacteria bacterium]